MPSPSPMQFDDVITLGASRREVWKFLQDPQQLGQCVPGLKDVEISESGRAFSGIARLPLGSSGMAFPARVEWVEQSPPHSGKLRAVATFSNYEIAGDGAFELSKLPEGGTVLSWSASVTIPEEMGKNQMLVQMAQMFAVRFIRSFFDCIEAQLQGFDSR